MEVGGQARVHWRPDAIVYRGNRPAQPYAVLDDWPYRRVVERAVGDRPF